MERKIIFHLDKQGSEENENNSRNNKRKLKIENDCMVLKFTWQGKVCILHV